MQDATHAAIENRALPRQSKLKTRMGTKRYISKPQIVLERGILTHNSMSAAFEVVQCCENVSDFRAVYVEWCYEVVAVCMGWRVRVRSIVVVCMRLTSCK